MYTKLSSRARSGEVNAVAGSFTNLISKSEHSDPVFTILSEKLTADNLRLTTALNQKTGSDKTNEVWSNEAIRDSCLKCLFFTVQGATYRANEEIAYHASLIYEVIKRHGRSMYNLPILEQSSKMDSLFEELDSDKLKVSLEKTGTTDLLTETKTANNNFLLSLSERSIEEAGKEEFILVREAMKTVRSDLNKIVTYLDTRISIEDVPALKQLNNGFTEIIVSANRTIKARQARNDNDRAE